jgi:hypothetical protein
MVADFLARESRCEYHRIAGKKGSDGSFYNETQRRGSRVNWCRE